MEVTFYRLEVLSSHRKKPVSGTTTTTTTPAKGKGGGVGSTEKKAFFPVLTGRASDNSAPRAPHSMNRREKVAAGVNIKLGPGREPHSFLPGSASTVDWEPWSQTMHSPSCVPASSSDLTLALGILLLAGPVHHQLITTSMPPIALLYSQLAAFS
ncbi:hypothetical protein BHM03_00012953 [Ensete ventricosum]|nr:hypothetical protein BHM03_00012953 [Ensete ventricosum]